MLEIRPPDPGSAVTWVLLWLATLVALAFVPVDRPGLEVATAADEARYSHDRPIVEADCRLAIMERAAIGVGGS